MLARRPVKLEDHAPLIDPVDVVGVGEAVLGAEYVLADDDSVKHILVLGCQHVRHLPDRFAVSAVDRGTAIQHRVRDRFTEFHGGSIKPRTVCPTG